MPATIAQEMPYVRGFNSDLMPEYMTLDNFYRPLTDIVQGFNSVLTEKIRELSVSVDTRIKALDDRVEDYNTKSIQRDQVMAKDILELQTSNTIKVTGSLPFDTLAKLQAWVPPTGTKKEDIIAWVVNDPDNAKNKRYVWNGSAWTPIKGDYDIDQQLMLDLINNKGLDYPLIQYGPRNGIPVKTLENKRFIRQALLNIRVLNARPNTLYRLSWYGNGSTESGTADYRWQFEEVSVDDWSVNDKRRRIVDTIRQPPYGKGKQTLVFQGTPDRSVTILVTLDTDELLASEGLSHALWSPNHTGYTYIIDSMNYTYREEPARFLDVPDNAPGDKSQGHWKQTPEEQFDRSVNGGQVDMPDCPVLPGSLGQAWFQFPELGATSYRPTVFHPASFWFYDIPLIAAKSFTGHSPTDLDMFGIVRTDESGVLRWSVRGDTQISTTIQGELIIWKKLLDGETKEKHSKYRCTLTLATIVGGPTEEKRVEQVLSACPASGQSEPFELIQSEFGGVTQAVKDIAHGGLWVKYHLAVNQQIILQNGGTYCFRILFNRVVGNDAKKLSNTGLKIESGSLMFNFDAAPLIRKNYGHRLFKDN